MNLRNLTIKQMQLIRAKVNPAFWYDDDLNMAIAKELDINIRSVRYAIKLITSKETGYYFSDGKI